MRPLIATPLALLTTIVIMLALTTPCVVRDIGIALMVVGLVALTYGWLLVRRYQRRGIRRRYRKRQNLMSWLVNAAGSGAGIVAIVVAVFLLRHHPILPGVTHPWIRRLVIVLMYAGGASLAVTGHRPPGRPDPQRRRDSVRRPEPPGPRMPPWSSRSCSCWAASSSA